MIVPSHLFVQPVQGHQHVNGEVDGLVTTHQAPFHLVTQGAISSRGGKEHTTTLLEVVGHRQHMVGVGLEVVGSMHLLVHLNMRVGDETEQQQIATAVSAAAATVEAHGCWQTLYHGTMVLHGFQRLTE